jgi:ABC-2 type transport system ATP-binding protein
MIAKASDVAVPAIEVCEVTKSFGESQVLRGVDLVVQRGTVFALLGPNGAGKTTAVRIMSTLAVPDSGTVRVAGYDVVNDRRAVRSRISLTGQDAALDVQQTGVENLRMIGRLRGLSTRDAERRAVELLVQFDLVDAGSRPMGTYSGGMRRRLDFAMGLVTLPEVLFLDEPTTGLDPRSRQAVWDVVTSLTAAGVTVLLTTQYLDEADRLADRVALLDGGRIIAEGTATELKRTVGEQRLELIANDDDSFAAVIAAIGERAVSAVADRRAVSVVTDGTAQHVLGVFDDVDPDRNRIVRFAVTDTTLDDVFMTLTGSNTEEPASV